MPKFLEQKLRAEYGNNAHAIYGTMNKLGAMHGNKETAKGREMERKHDMAKDGKHAAMREMRIEIHRGPKKEVTGFTVHHHMMPTPKSKSGAFYEDLTHSQPFSKDEHEAMQAHVNKHLKMQLSSGPALDAEKEERENEGQQEPIEGE